jgi:plastocyanin
MHFKSSVALAGAGLILAAVPATAAAGNRISLGDDYYSPGTKTVSKGTRVVWVNTGREAHTITTAGWSKTLKPGQRYARVVKRGFRYHCKFHSGMTGRVVVPSSGS